MRSKAASARTVALGGVLAAAAVVIMCLGTVIPVATYAAPVLCMMVGQMVLKFCGIRTAWCWYVVTAVLSLLLAPDKEAAAVFAVLGYYPIARPRLQKLPCPWVWKALVFNGSILALYWILLKLIGAQQLIAEFSGMGAGMTALLLILGNLTFFLLDSVLGRNLKKRNVRKGR